MFPSRLQGGVRATLVAAAFLLFTAAGLPAQQTGTISGQVTSGQTGEPMSAVEVTVPGTNLSAFTGPEGRYSIANVPAGEASVRARRLGFQAETRSVQVQAGETVTLNFTLQISPIALEGLVVTATGEQRRRELGNAATRLSGLQLMERAMPTNVTSMLQGQASGVTVQLGSGTTGASSTIRIRGNSSISLNNTPLIYIDGARVSNDVSSGPGVGGQNTSRLNDLNPNEIESIEIVKGPSAATLYGTEAAAGVIRITTKRGQTGEGEWTFRSELGGGWDDTDWPSNAFNPRAFFGEAAPDTVYTMNLLERDGTDLSPWRTGLERTTGISLRGGSEALTYFLSGDITDNEGSLPNNEMQRYSVRGNFSLNPSDNVQVSSQVGFSATNVELPDNDNNGFGYIGVALIGFPWEKPITRDDPVTGDENVQTCPLDFEVSRAFGVPLGTQGCAELPFFGGRDFNDVSTLTNQQKVERFTSSATIDYDPFDVLRLRGTVGYDEFSDQFGSLIPVDPDLPFGSASLGQRTVNHVINRNFTVEGSATLTTDLTPDLRSTTTLGGQFFREQAESAGSFGQFLPTGSSTVSNAVRTQGFENVVETRTLGLFVQQQFGFRDRLFITPAVRVDENSAFGENLGRQAYPRIMGSWVLSEEDWFPEYDALDFLRVRGAWGTSGKQPSSFAALQLLSAERVSFRDSDLAGIRLTRPGNPDLRPETGREVELGFETDLLEGRLGIDMTYYNQQTEDAIVTRPQAPSTGFSGAQFTNVGEMTNSGVELGLDLITMDRPGLFWDWRITASTNRGEITSLDEPIIFGLGGNSQRHQEGHPFASYFGNLYTIGDDGEVEVSDDPVFLGHPTPEWEGSVTTNVTLGDRLTLHANLGFAGGHQQFNSTEEFMCGFLGGGEFGGTCTQIFERDADGEPTDMARLKQTASGDQGISPWVEDADFLRLRTVSARIQLPDSWLGHLGATRGHFTIAGENLATFTNYSGLDPEISFAGGAQATRAEFLTLPPAKRVTGQFSITF